MIARRLALLLTAILVIGACGGNVTSLSFPNPPPGVANSTIPPPPPDLTAISLAPVAGRTTTTVAVTPGQATLSGTVVGPSGPVPAATVQAERVVGAGVGRVETSTQPDGTWTLAGVIGGLYRVRAWRAPDMALTTPEMFFLGGTENKSLTLQLTQYNATNVTAAVAPNPPLVNQPANLAVQVTTQAVDSQGVVRAVGVPSAAIQLNNDFNWSVLTSNPTSTDGNGQATWTLICGATGQPSMSVTVNNASNYQINVPACTYAPDTTTSSSSTSTTSSSVFATSTTVRRH